MWPLINHAADSFQQFSQFFGLWREKNRPRKFWKIFSLQRPKKWENCWTNLMMNATKMRMDIGTQTATRKHTLVSTWGIQGETPKFRTLRTPAAGWNSSLKKFEKFQFLGSLSQCPADSAGWSSLKPDPDTHPRYPTPNPRYTHHLVSVPRYGTKLPRLSNFGLRIPSFFSWRTRGRCWPIFGTWVIWP